MPLENNRYYPLKENYVFDTKDKTWLYQPHPKLELQSINLQEPEREANQNHSGQEIFGFPVISREYTTTGDNNIYWFVDPMDDTRQPYWGDYPNGDSDNPGIPLQPWEPLYPPTPIISPQESETSKDLEIGILKGVQDKLTDENFKLKKKVKELEKVIEELTCKNKEEKKAKPSPEQPKPYIPRQPRTNGL